MVNGLIVCSASLASNVSIIGSLRITTAKFTLPAINYFGCDD
jgi:hypothetical protein